MSDKTERLLKLAAEQPVIPVVAIDRAEDGVALARALSANGVKAIEVTLRTPAALDAIRAITAEVPEALCGAGTVLNPRQFEAAVEAGSEFVVSPGATIELLDAARNFDAPLLPGSATPSEMMAMLEEGYRFLKFFPAEPSGGANFLKALAPVFPDLKFCPTGGVSTANAGDYLKLPNVACVGGSWLAPKDLMAAGRWDEIGQLAADTFRLR